MNNKKLRKITLATSAAVLTVGLVTAISFEANAQMEEYDKEPVYFECVTPDGEVAHTGIDCEVGSVQCTPEHNCTGSF